MSMPFNAKGDDHVKEYDIVDYFLKNAAALMVEAKG